MCGAAITIVALFHSVRFDFQQALVRDANQRVCASGGNLLGRTNKASAGMIIITIIMAVIILLLFPLLAPSIRARPLARLCLCESQCCWNAPDTDQDGDDIRRPIGFLKKSNVRNVSIFRGSATKTTFSDDLAPDLDCTAKLQFNQPLVSLSIVTPLLLLSGTDMKYSRQ